MNNNELGIRTLTGGVPKPTHKEQVLAELETLYDPGFTVPEGLFIPTGQKYLVKECPQDEHITKGGIILSGAKDLQHAKIGVVYRMGESISLPIKIGMTIAYDKHCTFGIVHNSVAYNIVNEHEVHAIVPPKNYLMPKVETNDEKRRQDRIDVTGRIQDSTNEELDVIKNGTRKDFENFKKD